MPRRGPVGTAVQMAYGPQMPHLGPILFSQMGPRLDPYWPSGIAHMGPTWVLGAKIYGAHMGMPIRDPYCRIQMMLIWDVPDFPHTLPTKFSQMGPRLDPCWPSGIAHMGPTWVLGAKFYGTHMGLPMWDPYLNPDGAHMKPIWACYLGTPLCPTYDYWGTRLFD